MKEISIDQAKALDKLIADYASPTYLGKIIYNAK